MSDPRLELFVRSGAGLLLAAVVLGALWGAGRSRAVRLFGTWIGDISALATITWMATIVTLAAMVLGAFGVLQPLSWAALTLAGAVFLRGGIGRWRVHTEPIAAPFEIDRTPSWPFRIVTVGLVLGRFVYGLRNPPADVDSILYHMPMVAHWMATGALDAARFEPQQIGSFYPGNVEVLSLGSAWLIGRETLMTLPGVLALGLLALALRRLALEAGARRPIAEVMALGVACAPGVLQLTLGLRVENLMAAWLAAALAFALRARRTGARGDYEVTLCALGLLAGCKATGPALAIFVLCVLVAGAAARARFATALSCRFGLASLLIVGGFWFVRNAIAAGNPLYPAAITLGSWALPGLAGHADIAHTSQFAMWRAGLPGHLNVTNLWRYFGPVWLLWMPGALAGVSILVSPPRPGDRRTPIALLAAMTVVVTLLTIFQPFSGANAPEVPGGPLTFSSENVRYLMPTIVALVPLAAVGLSELPAFPVILTCAFIALAGIVPRAGHLVPALALVGLLGAAWSFRPRGFTRSLGGRVAFVLVPSLALAVAVTLVQPLRERMSDQAWNAIIARFDGVPADVAREVRDESGGRPIAVAGMVSIWALYGSELSGRPEYVPIGKPLAAARALWRYAPDVRDRADPSLWLRNLKESGAPFVVLASGEWLHPVEWSWCEHDSTHFSPVYVTPQQAVYRVTGNP